MTRNLPLLLALAAQLAAAPAAAFDGYVEGGIGFPELAHIRAGGFVLPRISVELYGANVLFNWLAGLSGTAYLLGDASEGHPPKHSLMLNAAIAINPTLFPPRVTSGSETIGAAFLFNVGYALNARSGFMFRVYSGGIVVAEDFIGGGPNLIAVGAGYRF